MAEYILNQQLPPTVKQKELFPQLEYRVKFVGKVSLNWDSFKELAYLLYQLKKNDKRFDKTCSRVCLSPFSVRRELQKIYGGKRTISAARHGKKIIEIEFLQESETRIKYKVHWYDPTKIPLPPPKAEWNYVNLVPNW